MSSTMQTDSDTRDKKLAADTRQFRLWRNWHHEQLAEAMRGPWHAELSELLEFLATMTTNHGDELIQLVREQG
jgi:hypothetical protein